MVTRTMDCDPLVAGEVTGPCLLLAEPLSLWGGVDPRDGTIIDRHHPQRGASLSGRVVVMSGGRGSSSAASVLAEMIRLGSAPGGLVLGEREPILVTGAVVAWELYGRLVPTVVADLEGWWSGPPPDVITISHGGHRLKAGFDGPDVGRICR